MANDTSASILPALPYLVGSELAQVVNEQANLLSDLTKKVCDTGASVNWSMSSSGAVMNWHTSGADFVAGDYGTNTLRALTLSSGTANAGFKIDREALIKAKLSRNPTAVADLFILRAMDSGSKLIAGLNYECWNGTGTNGGKPSIVGLLGGAIGAGSYAGLDSATDTLHQSTVIANAGVARALSIPLLQSAFRGTWLRSGAKPTVLWASPNTYDNYKSQFQSMVRVDSTAPFAYNPQADQLSYEGVILKRDRDMPEANGKGVLVGLYEPDVTFEMFISSAWEEANMMGVKSGMAQSKVQGKVQGGVVPVDMMQIQAQGDYVQYQMLLTCQLKVATRSKHFVISDIAI